MEPLEYSDNELEEASCTMHKYKKVSYTQVDKSLDKLYGNECEYYSSAMDILASYVRGQKLIYMESHYYRTNQLNKLMLPAIFYHHWQQLFRSDLTDLYGAHMLYQD